MQKKNKNQLYYVQRSLLPSKTVKLFLRVFDFKLPQETLLPSKTVTLLPSKDYLYISHMYTLFKTTKNKKYFNCGSKSVQIKSIKKAFRCFSKHQESTGLVIRCITPREGGPIDGIFDVLALEMNGLSMLFERYINTK